MIFPDSSNYAVGWFEHGKYHGYCKRINSEDFSINLEGLFEKDELKKFGNDIQKNKKSEYFKQKSLMEDEKVYFLNHLKNNNLDISI